MFLICWTPYSSSETELGYSERTMSLSRMSRSTNLEVSTVPFSGR
jgi:hypothetical protein